MTIPTIADAAREIRAGRLSPVALTEACLARIDRDEAKVNAFTNLMRDSARADAARAESEIRAGRWRGPLHGIPIGLKDVFYLAGERVTASSKLLLDFYPDGDATVVRLLKEAGAVIMGQLNTFEFAFGGPSFDLPFPPTRNPWGLDRSPGGSSSGSAAAVAAGFCLGAMGSDAGGSIRSPASLTGIAGIKPTIGRVSATGDIPLTYSHDTCGPMAWTAEDCALMLGIVSGYDPKDAMSADEPVEDYAALLDRPVRGLRVGVIGHFYTTDFAAPPAIAATVERVAKALESQGATIGEVRLSPLQDYHAAGRMIVPAEAYAIHEEMLRTRTRDYGEALRNRLMVGAMIRAADYIQAQRRRAEFVAEMEAALDRFDILVTAGMLTPQPKLDAPQIFAFLEVPMIDIPFNLTCHPTMSVCGGFFDDGMPIGVQIAGNYWDEATVLRAGHAVERVLGTRDRRPSIG